MRKLTYELYIGSEKQNIEVGNVEISDLIKQLTDKFNLNISQEKIEISYQVGNEEFHTEKVDYETYQKRKSSIENIQEYIIPAILKDSKNNDYEITITLANNEQINDTIENKINGEIYFEVSSENIQKLFNISFNIDIFLSKLYSPKNKQDK